MMLTRAQREVLDRVVERTLTEGFPAERPYGRRTSTVFYRVRCKIRDQRISPLFRIVDDLTMTHIRNSLERLRSADVVCQTGRHGHKAEWILKKFLVAQHEREQTYLRIKAIETIMAEGGMETIKNNIRNHACWIITRTTDADEKDARSLLRVRRLLTEAYEELSQ